MVGEDDRKRRRKKLLKGAGIHGYNQQDAETNEFLDTIIKWSGDFEEEKHASDTDYDDEQIDDQESPSDEEVLTSDDSFSEPDLRKTKRQSGRQKYNKKKRGPQKRRLFGRSSKNFKDDGEWRTLKGGHPDTCRVCSKDFDNDWDLCSHFHTKHTLPQLALDAEKAKEVATSYIYADVTEQMVNEKTVPTIRCEICNKWFKSPQSLGFHKRMFHPTVDGNSASNGYNPNPEEGISIDSDSSNTAVSAKVTPKVSNDPAPEALMPKKGKTQLGVKCGECLKAFSNYRNLKVHLLRYHPKEEDLIFHCDECDAKFSELEKVVNHRRVKHYEGDIFMCHFCGKGYKIEHTFQNHIKSHEKPNDRRRFKCEDCGIQFTSEKRLKKHKERVHGIKETKVRKKMGRPPKIRNPDDPNDGKKLRAPRYKVFLNEKTGELEGDTSMKFPKPCRSKHRKQKRRLPPEITEIEEGMTCFQCKLCDNAFASMASYYEHYDQRHTDGQVWVPRKSKTGETVTDQDKRIKCHLCKKPLNSRIALNLHLKKDHEEQGDKVERLACQHCKYWTVSKAAIDRHVMRIHPDIWVPQRGKNRPLPERYKQAMRDRGYSEEAIAEKETEWKAMKNRRQLMRHLFFKNMQRPQFFCKFCNIDLKNMTTITNHMSQHHPNYQPECCCDYCDYATFFEFYLKKHVLKRHPDKYVYQRKPRANTSRKLRESGLPVNVLKPPKKKRTRVSKKKMQEMEIRQEQEMAANGLMASGFDNQDSIQTDISDNSFAVVEHNMNHGQLNHTTVSIDFSSLTPVDDFQNYHQPSTSSGRHQQSVTTNQSHQQLLYHQQMLQQSYHPNYHQNPFSVSTVQHMLPYQNIAMQNMMSQQQPQQVIRSAATGIHNHHVTRSSSHRTISGLCKLCQEASSDLKSHYMTVHNVKEASVKDLLSWSGFS